MGAIYTAKILLSAVTAIGAGSALKGEVLIPQGISQHLMPSNVLCQYDITGSPTAVEVALQGSLDNVTWMELGKGIDVGGGMFLVTNQPALYYRGYLVTLTGGSSPAVTLICTGGV